VASERGRWEDATGRIGNLQSIVAEVRKEMASHKVGRART
jgi:hypothetical protein